MNAASPGMDSPAPRNPWSPADWPIAAKLGGTSLAGLAIIFVAVRLFAGSGEKTLRVPKAQLAISVVEQGVFHDLIPLRAQVSRAKHCTSMQSTEVASIGCWSRRATTFSRASL